MSNIENLKKQAKMVLRWHREGRLPIAERIRNSIPRCANLTDVEILSQPFQLADAQELIARENGFDGWQEIKTGVSKMHVEETKASVTAKLLGAMPQVFVRNVAESCKFYVEKLGFEITFTFGSPPFYAIVKRDGAVLNLRYIDTPVYDEGARLRDDVLAANIVVKNVKQLYLEYQASNVTFRQPLCHQPWGARDFIVEDPDQNLLLFASRNDEP
ncbi:MAG: VOC family protein [Steroidobacter sp.]